MGIPITVPIWVEKFQNVLRVNSDPGYTDMFSNSSVFISLHFQINPLWIAYLNVCIFMIIFIISMRTGETAMILLCFQMKTDPSNQDLSSFLGQPTMELVPKWARNILSCFSIYPIKYSQQRVLAISP